jgi:NAD(P)-dependent dehydrogenase (short-subunit alcohol dehydrogenase family)
MSKTVLITGGTDGIGKELAFQFAARGFTVHVLGRSKEKGEAVIRRLSLIYPEGGHRLFMVDLSETAGINAFLDGYTREYESLNMLVLNANTTSFKSVRLNGAGVDAAFMIGYLSRYMFSARLEELLKKGRGGVAHIGGATMIAPILYKKLKAPDYGPLKSTAMGFMAANLLVRHANSEGLSEVPYRFFEPGIVNTDTVRSQGKLTVILSRLFGMIEPEESAALLIKSMLDETWTPGQFYSKDRKKNPGKAVVRGRDEFHKLMEFSRELTGVDYKPSEE